MESVEFAAPRRSPPTDPAAPAGGLTGRSRQLARLSGVEFGLLLPGWGAETAMGVVGRRLAATPHGLTASAGVSCRGAALTCDQPVAPADRALHRARRDGRDRVVLLASGPRPPRTG